jgi:predicted nucleic-acid-binding Zn-ribbon protein
MKTKIEKVTVHEYNRWIKIYMEACGYTEEAAVERANRYMIIVSK